MGCPKNKKTLFSVLESLSYSSSNAEVSDAKSIFHAISVELENKHFCKKELIWNLRKLLSVYNSNIDGEMLGKNCKASTQSHVSSNNCTFYQM